ncbi:MAG: T9SS type A sorting domain-containing protein, partial [Bacteroidia bacterium]|nr:T9SS type A sorting domain-containing protein [Bacteroidia bacterium]
SKVYGEANPALTFDYSGWVKGVETIDTPPTISTTVTTTSNVGTYTNAITLTGGLDNNYTFNFVAADFTVTQAELTVTAHAKSKVYGEANPALTFVYSGWVNGVETIDTPPTISTTVTTTSNVGTYTNAITLTGGLDNNYTFNYVAADFEVASATLRVEADPQQKAYDGQVFPYAAFTVNYTGFVLNETPADLGGLLTYGAAATAVNAGNYTIEPAGLTSSNYTLVYTNASLTISKIPLVVTANDAVRCAGTPNPSFTLSYAGFIPGENTSVLDVLPTAYSHADASSIAGNYPISINGGSDNNYELYYIPGTLTVLAAPTAFAGNDAAVCINSTFTLTEATVSNATSILWTTSGDGTFDNSTLLNATYTPGTNDRNNGSVTLTLTSGQSGHCSASDAITLSFIALETVSVVVVVDKPEVCAGTVVKYLALATNQGNSPLYRWKVNGQQAGTNRAEFTYAPVAGDQVWVEITSSLPCVVQATVVSNVMNVGVTTPVLQTIVNPAAAGTTTSGGNFLIGTSVPVAVTPTVGWNFVNWTNQAGAVVSTQASFTYTVSNCTEILTANFVSATSLVGQVRFFNPVETTVPPSTNESGFYVQLFDNGTPVSSPQFISNNNQQNLSAYYAFNALESNKDYTLRIWEQAAGNVMGNTWTWNNWGGSTALDALIVNFMTVGNPNVASFPWIGQAPYTAFSNAVADVNNSATVSGLDALLINMRIAGFPGTAPYPGNRNNFMFTGKRVNALGQITYPNAPDVSFTSYGQYALNEAATSVYHEATVSQLALGQNVFNIYLTAAGDMNASFMPNASQKQAPYLHYNNAIALNVGDEIWIPVSTDQAADLGAITLGLNYNNQLVKIVEVEGFEIVRIDDEKGSVRLAWSDHQGRSYQAGQSLLRLKAKVLQPITGSERFMELDPMTELVSTAMDIMDNIHLSTTGITTGAVNIAELNSLKLNHRSMPNPFISETRIAYFLPESGKANITIFNQFGQPVKVLVNQTQEAGKHETVLYNVDLSGAGMYFYRITLEGNIKTWTEKGNLILTK